MKPKPNPVVKNLAQELGAFSKDMASSLKKSSSFKEEKRFANQQYNANTGELDHKNDNSKEAAALNSSKYRQN